VELELAKAARHLMQWEVRKCDRWGCSAGRCSLYSGFV